MSGRRFFFLGNSIMKIVLTTLAVILFATDGHAQLYKLTGGWWYEMTIDGENKVSLRQAFRDDSQSLIFEGVINKQTNVVSGIAYLQTKRCGTHPYSASGKFKERWIELTLRGVAPMINQACGVTSWRTVTQNFKIDARPAVE
jgi:hypothetical protein